MLQGDGECYRVSVPRTPAVVRHTWLILDAFCVPNMLRKMFNMLHPLTFNEVEQFFFTDESLEIFVVRTICHVFGDIFCDSDVQNNTRYHLPNICTRVSLPSPS